MSWVALALGAVAIFAIALYRRALRENGHLSNLVLAILLDEQVRTVQRNGLEIMIAEDRADAPVALGSRVNLYLGRVAEHVAPTMLANMQATWELRQKLILDRNKA